MHAGMFRYILFGLLWLLPLATATAQSTIEWKNGYWYDGSGFRKTTFFTVNGLLTTHRPEHIDSIIDLKEQFVIPPFGEAHNHAPDVELDFDLINERYLADGIFYVKNPNSIPFTTNKIRTRINQPRSVDVVYANGGLTANGGHPVVLYNYLLTTIYRTTIPGWTERSMEGQAYYLINHAEELEKKWPFILADKPAFIKAYLLYSEEYEQRKDDTSYNGKKGLNPKLLPLIVKKAKEAGLSVSCHVETPADLRNAIKAGVQEINHLPGYQVRWKEGYEEDYYLLSHALLRRMKRARVHADPTYSLAETELLEPDSLRYAARKRLHIRNLQRLRRHRIPLTIGCDSYNKTAQTEMQYLQQLHVFSNHELLRMWCINTPLAIFPQRKIARLQDGYEASFLVVAENPLINFNTVYNIQLRVKQGTILW